MAIKGNKMARLKDIKGPQSPNKRAPKSYIPILLKLVDEMIQQCGSILFCLDENLFDEIDGEWKFLHLNF